MFNETSDMMFKAYLTTSKTQGWFWRRGRDNPAATPAAPLTPGGARGAGAATPARPPKMNFNELDECNRHNLLQDLLIEYVALLTNPDSTTLSTPSHKKQERLERDIPREDARTAPARAAPAPAAGEGGGGGAGGGDGGGEGDSDGDGDGDIEEEDGAGDEDAAGAKPAAPKPKDKGLKG